MTTGGVGLSMIDDQMPITPIIHVWLNQQESPPEIKINGERHTVKAFSLRFDYQDEEKYRGELFLVMNGMSFRKSYAHNHEFIVICEGLQWRGRCSSIATSYGLECFQEVTIGLIGPPIVVEHGTSGAVR